MRGGNRSKAGLTALGFVLACAVGAGVAAVLVTPATPEALDRAKPVEAAPVTQRDLLDQRTLEAGFVLQPDATLVSPVSGKVTASTCSAGEHLVSGHSDLSVDGQRVVNLATSVPLWRDLTLGAVGEDVSALQTELTRLGFSTPVTGKVGSATLNSVRKLFRQAGDGTFSDASVPMSRLLWLPAAAVEVKSCQTAVGHTVAEGDTFATISSGMSELRLNRLPGDAIAGDRVVVVDDKRYPVDPDGRVTSPDALAGIAASASLADAVARSSPSLLVTWVLAEPVRASVVPPGALYDLNGKTGCVFGDSSPLVVHVVGSELGQTFVTFDKAKPPSEVSVSPDGAPSCR